MGLIHRPGHGYWPRLITAAAILAVAFYAADWTAKKILSRFSVPTILEISTDTSTFTVGEEQLELSDNKSENVYIPKQLKVEMGNNTLLLSSNNHKIAAEFSKTLTEKIAAISPDRPTPQIKDTTSSFKVILDNPIIVYCIFLLVGATASFIVLNRPRIVDFMSAVEAEMRKVHWPTRKELIHSTIVVIIGALMMAGFLLAVDIAFSKFFSVIHILPESTN